jgi:hypothetical protein
MHVPLALSKIFFSLSTHHFFTVSATVRSLPGVPTMMFSP